MKSSLWFHAYVYDTLPFRLTVSQTTSPPQSAVIGREALPEATRLK
ncbi:hypothetical protein M2F94_03705 [Vibrio vulnificus]|nr:hypothetical protein [Vibrio vulnificus]